ncbi:MAG: glycosyltransferase family 2 protein, partial [Bacteroidia bacterium]
GGGKPDFGHSGLSSDLWAMEKGELKNIKDCLHLNVINIMEYPLYVIFSLVKFIRRVLIVKLR